MLKEKTFDKKDRERFFDYAIQDRHPDQSAQVFFVDIKSIKFHYVSATAASSGKLLLSEYIQIWIFRHFKHLFNHETIQIKY